MPEITSAASVDTAVLAAVAEVGTFAVRHLDHLRATDRVGIASVLHTHLYRRGLAGPAAALQHDGTRELDDTLGILADLSDHLETAIAAFCTDRAAEMTRHRAGWSTP